MGLPTSQGLLLHTIDMIRQSDRAFGFAFAGFCFLIAVCGWLVSGSLLGWPLFTAMVFAALAVFIPGLLLPLNSLWHAIGPKIATINNAIILGVVFYLLITPIGLMMRLFRRDPMQRSIDKKIASYWKPVQRQADPKTFDDQF